MDSEVSNLISQFQNQDLTLEFYFSKNTVKAIADIQTIKFALPRCFCILNSRLPIPALWRFSENGEDPQEQKKGVQPKDKLDHIQKTVAVSSTRNKACQYSGTQVPQSSLPIAVFSANIWL